MKKKLIFFVLLLFLLGGISDAHGQWIESTGNFNTVNCFLVSGTNLFEGSGGVFLSTNNGVSWNLLTNIESSVFALAASNGTLFAGTFYGSVLRSTDNGANWDTTSLNSSYIHTFAISGKSLFAGTDLGVFLTTDNGGTWKAVNTGLPKYIPIYALAFSGTDLFAGANDQNQGGVFHSTDFGTSWKKLTTDTNNTNIWTIAVSGINLYTGTYKGVFTSSDNGMSWKSISNGLTNTDVRAFVVNGSNLFAGTYSGGVFLSTNNGTNWNAVNTGFPLTQTYVSCLALSGANLVAGSALEESIWHRPLSEMIGGNSVENPHKKELTLTSFPNPFTQSTSIKFSSSDHSFAQVSIHNLLGSEVARLFSGTLDAGEHVFSWDAQSMPPGMYVAMVKIGGEVREIPMMLVK